MAQRKRGRAAQRGKTARSRSTRNRTAAAKTKLTKRSLTKVVPRRKSAKAKAKRGVAKLTKPKMAAPREKPKELPIEIVKVEQVHEPAPGVVAVSEYESVQVGPTSATTLSDELK